MRGLLSCFVVATALAVAAPAWADPAASEKDEDASRVIYKKKTIVDFADGDVIDGSLKRPDGELVESQRSSRFESLLRVRQSFRDEILNTVYDPTL